MLLLGYCMGIRSKRRLCEEVHVNLAYRWFCRLDMVDLDNAVIVDVEPSEPIRTAEAFAARRMIDRITVRFGMTPGKLVGDTGRRVMRPIHEAARDIARDIRKTGAYMTSFIQRRRVEMLFAPLKQYVGVPMMRLRGPNGAYEQFQLAASAQHLRQLAKLVPEASTACRGTRLASFSLSNKLAKKPTFSTVSPQSRPW